MKLLGWVLLGLAVAGLAFWSIVVTHANPVTVFVFVAATAVATLGAFWKMYMSTRREKNPWPMILLSFLPFSSFWYYFERVRHDKHPVRWRGVGWPER